MWPSVAWPALQTQTSNRVWGNAIVFDFCSALVLLQAFRSSFNGILPLSRKEMLSFDLTALKTVTGDVRQYTSNTLKPRTVQAESVLIFK